MPIFMAIFGVIGIICGIQLTLWIQFALFVIAIFYLNSHYVAMQEIGSLFHYLMVICLFIGVAIGDIVYAIQKDIPIFSMFFGFIKGLFTA